MPKRSAARRSTEVRPICFMVMPYGTRPTGIQRPGVPETVDYNELYEKALKPAIEAQGYLAVRADQETSPLIVLDMLERLTLADLVLADLTMHNGNVYYEVGVRHATEQHNCVLIAAEWAQPQFDLNQIRQGRYPLPDGKPTAADYRRASNAVGDAIKKYADSASPVHRALDIALKNPAASTFAETMEQLAAFQTELRAIELDASPARRATKVRKLVAQHAKHGADHPMLRAVAIELLHAVRDHLSWKDAVAFLKKLPTPLRRMPYIREQLHLAESKTGDDLKAIAALEQLIKEHGETSERRGLVAGRYKSLYNASVKARKPKSTYLDHAIEHYERGMQLDLNDYFPSCNLPRLYRQRAAPGDLERAIATSHVVVAACERAKQRKSQDRWLRPTLLGAAFDAGDVVKAHELAAEVRKEGPARWMLDTTLNDLRRSAKLQEDEATRKALERVVSGLAKRVK